MSRFLKFFRLLWVGFTVGRNYSVLAPTDVSFAENVGRTLRGLIDCGVSRHGDGDWDIFIGIVRITKNRYTGNHVAFRFDPRWCYADRELWIRF